MSINTPPITPQQYEVLHGGGAEAAEIAKQRLSRRRFLRRSMLAVFGLSTTAAADGSLWVALYQRCVHLGCTVPFRDDCVSFKCPCHGSHYNVDGEYLDGPAPRSLDRFAMSLGSGPSGTVTVSTGTLNNTVPHPDA